MSDPNIFQSFANRLSTSFQDLLDAIETKLKPASSESPTEDEDGERREPEGQQPEEERSRSKSVKRSVFLKINITWSKTACTDFQRGLRVTSVDTDMDHWLRWFLEIAGCTFL